MKTLILEIRENNLKEEFNYLWSVLLNMPFYIEYGYKVSLPEQKYFKQLTLKSPNFSSSEKQDTFKIFSQKVYDPAFYKKGVSVLENERYKIEQCFTGLLEMNKQWGFKLLPKYQILLTRFGPGGSYDENTGVIIMLTKKDGTFKVQMPSHTPVHEVVHIGIETNIVQKFKLTHAEKERLVDLVVLNKFGDILNGYKLQNIGDPKLDSYINSESLKNLPLAIQKYVNDFSR